MKIEKIAVEKIKPAKYNPRVDLKPGDPDYEKLKRSISEFDTVEPLVWNKRTGNLVGGHRGEIGVRGAISCTLAQFRMILCDFLRFYGRGPTRHRQDGGRIVGYATQARRFQMFIGGL